MAAAGKKASEGRQGSKSKELMSDRVIDAYSTIRTDGLFFPKKEKEKKKRTDGIHTRQIQVDGREP